MAPADKLKALEIATTENAKPRGFIKLGAVFRKSLSRDRCDTRLLRSSTDFGKARDAADEVPDTDEDIGGIDIRQNHRSRASHELPIFASGAEECLWQDSLHHSEECEGSAGSWRAASHSGHDFQSSVASLADSLGTCDIRGETEGCNAFLPLGACSKVDGSTPETRAVMLAENRNKADARDLPTTRKRKRWSQPTLRSAPNHQHLAESIREMFTAVQDAPVPVAWPDAPGPWNDPQYHHYMNPTTQVGDPSESSGAFGGLDASQTSGGANSGTGAPLVEQEERSQPAQRAGPRKRFPCVYHRWGECEDPTSQCRNFHQYVSHLRVHHGHHDHPDGPFFYCRKCYRKDFDGREEADLHDKHCTRFICIKEGCHNYGQVPPQHTPCNSHTSKPSQRSKWRMTYRQAHNLGPDDEVPETGGATPVPGSPTLHVPVTLSPATSIHTTPALSRANSQQGQSSFPSPSSPFSFPQTLPIRYAQDYTIAPFTSPSTGPLQESTATGHTITMLDELATHLDGLARDLLPDVIHGRTVLEPMTAALYSILVDVPPLQINPALREDSRIARLARRIPTLRALIREYRCLIEQVSSRSSRRWSKMRRLTKLVLGEDIPAAPPREWFRTMPSNRHASARIDQRQPESDPRSSRTHFPAGPFLHISPDVTFQIPQATDPTYDQTQMPFNPNNGPLNFADVPVATNPGSNPTDHGYHSGGTPVNEDADLSGVCSDSGGSFFDPNLPPWP